MSEGGPLDEYKIACEFLRSCATLRFLRFTMLMGTTGGLIGTIVREIDRTHILASRYLHLFLAMLRVFVLDRGSPS